MNFSAVSMNSLVANDGPGVFPCERSFSCDKCLANASVSSFLPLLRILLFVNQPSWRLLATTGVLWVLCSFDEFLAVGRLIVL